ncbi:MAG: type II secretion system protein [bacterium]
MQKQTIKSKQEGFTIIEVLIVLAIAALILLVVFLAVPGLQRSQANNSAKNDATRIAASITNFVSNNNGILPTATDVAAIYSDSGNLGKLAASISSGVTINSFTGSTPTTGTWYFNDGATTYKSTSTGTIWSVGIDKGAKCSTPTYGPSVATVDSTGQVAILYTSITGGVPNWNCIQAQ